MGDCEKSVLFTPGPVMLDPTVRKAGSLQMVYHRTEAFSRTILRCQEMLKQACFADEASRVMFITGSGTAAMEGALVNLFKPGEGIGVVDAGDFGKRFADIGSLHGHPIAAVLIERGQQIRCVDLESTDFRNCRGLFVSHHETSTGSLLDLRIVADFCRERGLLLIVDAIGSFLAEPLNAGDLGIDALIVSSQKGLGLGPGMSFVILGPRAVERTLENRARSYYFDFRKHLCDLERGQTPFTPAVGLIRQLELRLADILEFGVAKEISKTWGLALDFRARLAGLPFRLFSACPAHAVTALSPSDGVPAIHYVNELQTRYGLFVCPNGGSLRDKIFRVGHLGHLTLADNAKLANALSQVAKPR